LVIGLLRLAVEAEQLQHNISVRLGGARKDDRFTISAQGGELGSANHIVALNRPNRRRSQGRPINGEGCRNRREGLVTRRIAHSRPIAQTANRSLGDGAARQVGPSAIAKLLLENHRAASLLPLN